MGSSRSCPGRDCVGKDSLGCVSKIQIAAEALIGGSYILKIHFSRSGNDTKMQMIETINASADSDDKECPKNIKSFQRMWNNSSTKKMEHFISPDFKIFFDRFLIPTTFLE